MSQIPEPDDARGKAAIAAGHAKKAAILFSQITEQTNNPDAINFAKQLEARATILAGDVDKLLAMLP